MRLDFFKLPIEFKKLEGLHVGKGAEHFVQKDLEVVALRFGVMQQVPASLIFLLEEVLLNVQKHLKLLLIDSSEFAGFPQTVLDMLQVPLAQILLLSLD